MYEADYCWPRQTRNSEYHKSKLHFLLGPGRVGPGRAGSGRSVGSVGRSVGFTLVVDKIETMYNNEMKNVTKVINIHASN